MESLYTLKFTLSQQLIVSGEAGMQELSRTFTVPTGGDSLKNR